MLGSILGFRRSEYYIILSYEHLFPNDTKMRYEEGIVSRLESQQKKTYLNTSLKSRST